MNIVIRLNFGTGPGAVFAGLLLAGCGSPPGEAPDRDVVRDPVAIVYESRGCYGSCPIYRVEARRDGFADYVGRDHVAVRGARRLRLSPEQFRRLADFVAPLRPSRGSIPRAGVECNIGDGPSWSVEWVGADGARQHLCVGPHGQLPDPVLAGDRIRGAPALLPIGELVGPVE